MDSIFLWLVGGVAGLLLTAGAVALWEHLRRSVRPQEEFTSSAPKAVKIDLRLDRLPAQPAAPAPPTAAAATTSVIAPVAAPLSEPVMAPEVAPVQGGRPVAAAKSETSPTSEMQQRHAALEEVLARMSQPAGLDQSYMLPDDTHDSPRFWAETTPMVGPGQLEPQEPAPSRRPGPSSASRQP